jgi:hypothetical protein
MVVMEGNPKEVWTLLTRLHSRGQMKRFWLTARNSGPHRVRLGRPGADQEIRSNGPRFLRPEGPRENRCAEHCMTAWK